LTTSPAVPVLARDLCKSFKSVVALQDVSLTVEDRRFVTIVGPSGCGKSTLLRLISGLIPPTSGEVFVRGKRVTAPITDVGMVFQSPVLMPWRNTLDNILFVAEMRGESGGKYRSRALELIELAGLSGFETRRPHELSGGMQQRVALCRALIQQPKVLLMDEPFSALDALTREELARQLQEVHMNLRPTTIFVTHSIQEAVLLADRVAVLSARPGRIRRVLTADIPRPRSFGHNAHLADVAGLVAELTDLLHATDAPTPLRAS